MSEILVILVLALIFLGPKKLPEIASGIGKAIREVRKATADIKNELELDEAIRKPLEELREATMLPPEELKRRDEMRKWQAQREKEEAEAARLRAEKGLPEVSAEAPAEDYQNDGHDPYHDDESLDDPHADSDRTIAAPAPVADAPSAPSAKVAPPSATPPVSDRNERTSELSVKDLETLSPGPRRTVTPPIPPGTPSDRTIAMPLPPPMEGAGSSALPKPGLFGRPTPPVGSRPLPPPAKSLADSRPPTGSVPRPAATLVGLPTTPPTASPSPPATPPAPPAADGSEAPSPKKEA